jgi:hypothetical protein
MATQVGDQAEWARSEARRLKKALREAQPTGGDGTLPGAGLIQGHPLKKGITEKLFGDLIVGCLLHYKATRDELKRREDEFRPSPILQNRKIRTALETVRCKGLPGLVQPADRLLNLNASMRRHGERFIPPLKVRLRFLDPVACLYVLFRYLVLHNRRLTIEWYEEHYFPSILLTADIPPDRAKNWTLANIQRRLRPDRKGGEALARQIAGLLLSTHPALRRYRPEPRFNKGIRPALGEWQLALQGRMLYSVETIPPPPPWLRGLKQHRKDTSCKPHRTSCP